MNTRLNMQKVQPEAYKALLGLEKYLNGTQLTNTHKDLIKIRASQLNGCAYCINMHTKEAREHGEAEQRLYLLSSWRETDLYTEEERAILALTEEGTLLSQYQEQNAYAQAASLFSETYLAQLIMAILVINAWNRIGVITRPPLD